MGISDKINPPKTTALSFGLAFNEEIQSRVRGDVRIELDGVTVLERTNIYTLDGGVLAAMLFSGVSRPLNMLAVGTGASGSSSSPDLADNRQRKLNAELIRKNFSSTVYRTSAGAISAVPTNVIDFTTVFSGSEAVGALTEMGLVSTFDPSESVTTVLGDVFPERDTTSDLNDYDVLVNYLTFPVINKPSGAVLAITWRLTF